MEDINNITFIIIALFLLFIGWRVNVARKAGTGLRGALGMVQKGGAKKKK